MALITYVNGNLFESPAQVLVNTVNTVGAMGKGIAKDFAGIYPDMFQKYQALCEKGSFVVGQLWLYRTPHKWILNFPTKAHWRQPSKVEYIELGLQKFVKTYQEKGITSIAFPALGCGNGGLDWDSVVRPLMEDYLKNLSIDTFVYLYDNSAHPEHDDIVKIKQWLHGSPRRLPFTEFCDDLADILKETNDFAQLSDISRVCQCYPSMGEDGLGLRFEEIGTASIDIENWQLLDLWRQIRNFGFCMENTMPCGLEPVAGCLMGLLSRLEYIKPVKVSRTYDGLKSISLGLQVLPPTERPEKIEYVVESLEGMQ